RLVRKSIPGVKSWASARHPTALLLILKRSGRPEACHLRCTRVLLGREESNPRSQRRRNQPPRPSQPRLALPQRTPRSPPHLQNQTHPVEKPANLLSG